MTEKSSLHTEVNKIDDVDISSSEAALEMMQRELPQYLQHMLLACGYDRLHIIAEMNVNQTDTSQPNDVDKILDYVKHNFPSDSRLVGMHNNQ